MPEFDDDDLRSPAPEPGSPEGVRILGAEEAQATVQGQGPTHPEDAPRPRTTLPPETQPAARFQLPEGLPPETRPSPRAAPVPEPSGPIPLPHWTEPPTGEVPQIGGDDLAPDTDEDAWGAAPRFRAEGGGGWDDGDFGSDEGLHDDTTALGALVDLPEVDEDEVFAAEVQARRAPERRTRTGTRPSRSARTAARADTPGGVYPGTDDLGAPARSAPARGDDLATRVVTGIVLAAVGLLCFALGNAATAVLVTVIVTAAGFELYEGFRRAGFQPATLIGLLGCVSIVGVAYNYGERAFGLVTALVVVFSMLWYLAKVVHARPMVNIAVTVLGYAYVGVLGGFAGVMLVAPNGVGMIIGLVVCAIGYDIAGYVVGSRMGRRSLAPEWSPNKTLEGLFAGMAASVVLGAIVGGVLGITPWNSFSHGLLLGIVVAIFAPLGDLCESMLKRDLGLKDFGTVLPGHGGVLDRFDAMLFCLPAVYYLVLALGLS
ncbi:MAG: phosphatidate cytidylyltransferase [Acidimicrobiia bacterium]